MKYDKKVKLVIAGKVSDGMGGWVEGEATTLQVVESFLTPIRANIMMAEYGIATSRGMKLFTKTPLLLEDQKGKIKDILVKTPDKRTYKIIEYTDFTKVKMLVLSEVLESVS